MERCSRDRLQSAHDRQQIDDRLRGEAGNRGAADVMDLGYQAVAGGQDLLARGREVCSPSRIVRRQDDHESYCRIAASPMRSTPAAAMSV